MKLRLIAVGTRPPEWVKEGFAEYARRLPREMPLELVELSPATRSKGRTRHASDGAVRQIREAEGERLLAQVKDTDWVVALDEHGKTWSTLDLAQKLDNWRMQGRDVTFLIGGAEGLADACRARADEILSLSAMTLPHALVRVVLAEQLYRAWTVASGHPYHRGG
ncbi:MAG TPA: 23S rRNA (pseudouridine(1915)-N(3))-methyltransferase RlmH [Pseudomonadales bacterium]